MPEQTTNNPEEIRPPLLPHYLAEQLSVAAIDRFYTQAMKDEWRGNDRWNLMLEGWRLAEGKFATPGSDWNDVGRISENFEAAIDASDPKTPGDDAYLLARLGLASLSLFVARGEQRKPTEEEQREAYSKLGTYIYDAMHGESIAYVDYGVLSKFILHAIFTRPGSSLRLLASSPREALSKNTDRNHSSYVLVEPIQKFPVAAMFRRDKRTNPFGAIVRVGYKIHEALTEIPRDTSKDDVEKIEKNTRLVGYLLAREARDRRLNARDAEILARVTGRFKDKIDRDYRRRGPVTT